MMIFWVILAIVVLWIVAVFNKLVVLKNQVSNAWRQIDVQLKRRYDLIPNLVETVRGVMKFEQDTLTKVIEARNKAMAAQSIPDKAAQENVLTGALRQLFALVENYPQIKSNTNVTQLQEELTSTENKISFARQFYNDLATQFNIAQQVFPTNLIASIFGFSHVDLFQVASEAEKQVPKVNLDLK
ncbi:MAG: LemA family protein [Candidatus Omnitrophota bacterium]